MFGDKTLKLIDQETTTLLDQDAQFEGKLTFEGKVQINGRFQGEVFSQGTLIIGEGAQVDAKIEVDTVIIQGHVQGSVLASSRVEMHPPAVVKGDITSPGLIISEGALFEGNCSMGSIRNSIPETQVQKVILEEPSLETNLEAKRATPPIFENTESPEQEIEQESFADFDITPESTEENSRAGFSDII